MQLNREVDRFSNIPEDDLVRRAVRGEETAFAALYDQYVDRIYRFLRYRAPDDDTAQDLTSEVFLRAWDHLDSFEPGGAPFGAWLFRIARNLAIDHARTRKPKVPLDTLPSQEVRDEKLVEEHVAGQVDLDRLMDLFRELTEPQREVLTLKFVEGLGTAEVAKVMGKKPGAIRALQMRGLQALEAVLNEKGWSAP